MIISHIVLGYMCRIVSVWSLLFQITPTQLKIVTPHEKKDISGQGLMWYARPHWQLFFNCRVCPTGRAASKHSHMVLSLVFFSTFEPINIMPQSVMLRTGVPMRYNSASSSNEPSTGRQQKPWRKNSIVYTGSCNTIEMSHCFLEISMAVFL